MLRRWCRGPAIVVLGALAAACSSDVRGLPVTERQLIPAEGVGVSSGPAEAPTPTAAPIPGPQTPIEAADPTAVMPLTGRARSGRADLPAVAVRIDNTRDALPQRGLVDADVVIENLVEGRLTRLLAVYQTTLPESVGPVRSARSTDADLLPAFGNPGFVYWSSNDGVANELAGVAFAEGLVDLGIGRFPDAYVREDLPERPVELTGFASLPELAAELPADAGAPPPLFSWRAADAVRAQPLVPGIRIDWGATQEVSWVWAADTWVRSQFGRPHLDERGVVVTAANVVVIETDYGISDADPTSPQAVSVGSGRALILTDGALIEATWVRPSPRAGWSFEDTTGAPVLLAPGATWIEIVVPLMAELLDPARVTDIVADAAPFLPES